MKFQTTLALAALAMAKDMMATGRGYEAVRLLNSSFPHHGPAPRKTTRPPKTTNLYRSNGDRECARRRAQIAAGSLKRENGLVTT